MSQFLHDKDDINNNNRAIAIPWVFSKHSQANKKGEYTGYQHFLLFPYCRLPFLIDFQVSI